jgi:IclR family acetate operon transcriptional repressor
MVLFAFSPETPQLGVAEIAKIVGLNRTTVHRLVGTLESSGLLRKDPFTQKFGLSAQVLRLADVFYQQNDIRSIALPRMTALRNELNETVALHLREGFARVVIAQIGAHRDVRHMYRNIGEPIPLHLGAPGRVILAHLEQHDLEDYLSEMPLVGTTSQSITDPDVLREELREVASQGYAVSWEERRVGVVAIAAPIFDAHGQVVASINVSGPIQRIRQEQVDEIWPRLVEVAKEVSFLFGRPDPIDRKHHQFPSPVE